jgi:3-oxoacyl-[acyl-carrier protein] reductase
MDLNIKGKVAVVTGGARGIGKEIAEALSNEGAVVCITDLNEPDFDLNKMPNKAFFYKVNVTDLNAVNEVVNKIVEEHGSLDILVNNAGVTKDTLLLRMKEEDWDFVLNVNLKGVFNFTKASAPVMMKKRWGRIVNISSVVGLMGNVGQANYSASKAGMIGFTKTIARELAPRGITANAIAPGFIVSEMTDKIPEKAKEEFFTKIPAKRFGEQSEVADLVSFFASDKSSYITGQVVSINGGMLM